MVTPDMASPARSLATLSYPVLVVADVFWIIASPHELASCSRYALVKGNLDGMQLFDSACQVYPVLRILPERPLTLLTRWLARTVYNPRVAITLELGEPREASLADVCRALDPIIDDDPDDLYNQFLDPDELKRYFRAASSFDVLLERVEWCGAELDGEGEDEGEFDDDED